MKEIRLTQGKVTVVDDADYESLMQWKWCAVKNHRGDFYAMRGMRTPSDRFVHLKMHRVLALPENAWRHDPLRRDVDHRDHNTLNNQRFNLRVCSHMQNTRNKNCKGLGVSPYKGVGFQKSSGKWRARICVNYQQSQIGLFETQEEAARAYDAAAVRLHGEFAYLNFPTETALAAAAVSQ